MKKENVRRLRVAVLAMLFCGVISNGAEAAIANQAVTTNSSNEWFFYYDTDYFKTSRSYNFIELTPVTAAPVSGGNNLVTNGQVYSYVEGRLQTISGGGASFKANLVVEASTDARSDEDTSAKNTIVDDENNVLATFKTGSIASADTGFLSGGTAYTELRPVTSTNYLATTNTTAVNLSNLDLAIGKVSTAGNYLVVSGMTATDNVAANLSNLDLAIGKASAGNYIVASGMTTTDNIAANLSKLDTAIGKVSGSTHYLTAQDGTASANVATNLKELDDALYEHEKLVKANNETATSATKILIGNDADFANVTEISVAKTDNTTRTISGVSNATTNGQAATWDQIAASGKTIKLSTEKAWSAGSNMVQYNQIATNDGTVLATFQKMDKIAIDDEGFVSGKDLYKELKVTESGSYVTKSNTTAENLLALDRAVSGGGIVRVGTENKDTIYVGLNPEGETTYSAVTSINIGNGGTRTLKGLASGTAAGEAVEFSQINTVTPTQVNGSYIQGTLNANNTINENGTVGANLAALDAKAVSSASGVNAIDLSDDSKKLVSNDGTTLATFTRMAELKSTDYGFVSGADLYNETRAGVASTNYISQSTDAGANLSALDAAIGRTAKGKYIEAQDGTTVTVATNLAALDTALEKQAKLVRVSDDDTTKILVGSDVSHAGVKTIDVSNSGTTRMIAGVSRGTASGQAATWDQIAQEGQTVSLSAATHDVNGKNIQANQIATNDGKLVATFSMMGNVAQNDTGFVSGGNLWAETRQNATGTYIAATNDAGTNLAALDAKIGTITDANTNVVKQGNTVSQNLEALDQAITDATYTGSDTIEIVGKAIKVKNMTQNADEKSLSLGFEATAEGKESIALGSSVTAKGQSAVALGRGSHAEGNAASAIGVDNAANALKASAIGFYNEALGQYSTAIGFTNKATGTGEAYNVAIGASNIATGEKQAVAIGFKNEATQSTATAIGKTNQAYAGNSTAVGISNVAGATGATYSNAAAVGISNEATNEKASAFGYTNKASGKYSSAFGMRNEVSGDFTSAFGYKNTVSANGAVAIGNTTTAKAQYATVVGVNSTVAGAGSNALGFNNKVYGGTASAIGDNNTVGADGATSGAGTYVFGANNTVTANNALILGTGVKGTVGDGAIVLGTGITGNVAANSVVIGDASTSEESNTVSVGSAATQRKIVHVADGEDNTDAATYGQLASDNQGTAYEMDENGVITVSTNANGEAFKLQISGKGSIADGNKQVIDGGTAYTYLNPTTGSYVESGATTAANLNALDSAIGKVTGGTYISAQDDTHNVATNLGELDTALATHAKLVRVGDIKDGENPKTIFVGKDLGDTKYDVDTIDIGNGGTRTITGVAAGTKTGEAATWEQLASDNDGVAYTMDDEGVITVKTNGSADAFKLKISGKGSIQNGNQQVLDGNTVYAYLSPATEGNYIKPGVDGGKTTAENLTALDTAIGKVTGTKGTDFHYLDAQDGDAVNVATNLKQLDAAIYEQSKIVRVSKEDSTQILIGRDGADETDFANVTTIDVSNGGTATRKITGVTYGGADSDAAAYGQILKAGQTIQLGLQDGNMTLLSNDEKTTLATFTVTEAAVSSGNIGIMTGNAAYNELRNDVSGNYLDKTHTTGQNLSDLSKAIGKVTGSKGTDFHYIDAQDGDAVNVATNLKQLDSALYEYEKIVRKGADSDADKILIGNDDAFAGVTTVSVAKKDGTARTVMGVAAGTNTGEAATWEQLASDNGGDAYEMDADGVITVKTNGNADAFKLKISGDGSIEADSGKLITGGTAYAYLSPAENGNYIRTGGTDGKTTGENLAALDSAIGKVTTGGIYISAQDETHNVATNLQELDAAIAAQSKIVRVSKEDPTQILIGRDGEDEETFAKVTTIDVSNGGTATRKITGVTYGGATNDAAAYGQILAADQKIQLGLQDGNMTLLSNDKKTTLATFTVTEAAVSSGNIGIMTGNAAYNELRPTTTGHYISDQTTKANLAALDSAIGVTEAGTYISAQKSQKDGKVVTVATNLAELDKAIATQSKIVRVGGESNEKILIGRDDADETTFANVTTIDVGNAGKSRTVTGVVAAKAANEAVEFSQIQTKAGETQANGTYLTSTLDAEGNLAAAGTVGANLAALDAKAVSTKEGTNVINLSDTSKKLVSNDGTTLATFTRMASVSGKDFGFVSGADLYNELRVVGKKGTDYNYIDEGNTTAENLIALDAAVKAGGSDVLKLIKRDGATIFIGKDTDYADVTSVDVGNGGTRTITGVGAGTQNTDAANVGQLVAGGTVDLSATGNKVYTNGDKKNALLTFTKMKEVSESDTGFVSGADLYNETRKDITSTNYISQTASAGANLSTLDAELAKVAKANTDAVAAINADLKVSDGHYLKAANKANANLTALDTAIGKVDKDGNVIKKTYGDDGKFAVSVADNLKNLDDKIGSIADKTDGTSYTAISKDATVSDNLVALDKAISEGVAADFTKIQNAAKYENAKASGENAIALGNQSDASGATGAKAMALGTNASATEENAVAIGTKSNASGANALALGNGAAASGEGSVAIGSGSVAKEANVVSVGSEGAERRITNVADGVNDTDAVNVSQLNRSFANMQSELTADINKVGAGAAALSALRPEGFDPTDKISFAVGYGHYRSANAGALGVFYKPNADTTLSLGGTLGNGDSMMSAGVSFKLGSGAKAGIYPTGAALSQEMASLRKNNDKLSADNKSLKKDNAAQATAIKTQAKQIENLKADNEKIKADNAKMKADNEQMKKQIAMILSKMEMSDTVKKTAAK